MGIICKNGISYGGGSSGSGTLVDLSDTNISSPTDKQALVYDETSEKWVNADIESDSLENLADVGITNPEEGDVITYNSETEKWENKQGVIGNTSDDIPYLTRETNNGNRVGSKRVVKDLVGGSVVANQLVQNGNFASLSVWSVYQCSYTVAGNVATIKIASDKTEGSLYQILNGIKDHKYIEFATVKSDGTNTIALRNDRNFNVPPIETTSDTFVTLSRIMNCVASGDIRVLLTGYGADTEFQAKNVVLIDLTAMFGTTVADALYSMEQATAGSGVALFRQLFPNDYYAYQTGSLVSVKPSAMVSGGKTYPISEVDLRGLLSLSNGKWVYDGDVRTCGGEITRKYGIVDLGTLTYTYDSDNSRFKSTTGITNGKNTDKAICPLYAIKNSWTDFRDGSGYLMYIDSGTPILYIKNPDYTDATTFKTAMSGVYLIYELATPTTEYVPAFSEIQDATENGTESFTDARTFPMPVAHHTDYPYGELGDTIFDSLSQSNTTITYSEFLQMSDAEQLAFTGYVTDYPGIDDAPVADDVIYDNTDSGLTANNVQDAIDEVNDNIDVKLNGRIDTKITQLKLTKTTGADGYINLSNETTGHIILGVNLVADSWYIVTPYCGGGSLRPSNGIIIKTLAGAALANTSITFYVLMAEFNS